MKRSTGKTSALGILVFSHSFRLRFAGMHVRAIELSSVLGSSMHFVSTIFTTIGYGGVTPATLGISLHFDRNKQKMNPSTLYIFLQTILSGGKFMTILMIITLIPFFLHCLCTSASNLNNLIDRFAPTANQQHIQSYSLQSPELLNIYHIKSKLCAKHVLAVRECFFMDFKQKLN